MSSFVLFFVSLALAYHGFSQTRRDMLDVVPVQRRPFRVYGPTFKWEIYHHSGYSLLAGNLIKSREFWWNGYKMKMQLRLSTSKVFYELSLRVLSLNSGSQLRLKWSAHSPLFKSSVRSEKINSWHGAKRNTFKRWKIKREVDVYIKFVRAPRRQ